MGIAEILTELATAASSTLKILLPGAAEAAVEFGEKLVYQGTGDQKQVTVIFGMAILGTIIGFCTMGIKRLVKKVS